MTAPHEPTSETQSREARVAIGEHEQSLAAMTTRDGPSSTPVATSAQSPKAEQVGHYRLVREIASGGFGIVFEAQHATLGFLVAVKVIRRSANSAELREFASEARRLSLFIGQPGIVEIRDYGVEREADGTRRPYLVMNLLQGRGVGAEAGRPVRARSLTTYARVHSLSDGQKLEMFAKVCDAVHLTHEQRIVHRDLKPSNIIVHEPETGPARPVVIDFGISLTTTGTGQGRASGIAGTIPYMSPEQTRGTDELDRRSDVYTLGVILYELLCGQLPYPVLGGQRTDSYSVIQNTPPDFASSAATGISVHLRQILTRAMAKQPDQRYQTAADLAADLRAVLGGDVPREARRHLGGRARAIVRRTLVGRSWIFLAIAAIIAAGFTDYVGRRSVYDWTPLGSWFENQFVRTDLMPDMTDVVLVVRRDSTFFAAGMPDLKDKPTQRSKLRPYIGGLLEAIAEANPHCVGIDLGIVGELPGNAEIGQGIRAIVESRRTVAGASSKTAGTATQANPIADVPVVLALEEVPLQVQGGWRFTDPDLAVSPLLLRETDRLASAFSDSATVEHEARLASVELLTWANEAGSPVPGIALELYAASQFPAAYRFYEIDPYSRDITIRFCNDAQGLQPIGKRVIAGTRREYNVDAQLWRDWMVVAPVNQLKLGAAMVAWEDVVARKPEAMAKLKGKVVVVGADNTLDDRHFDTLGNQCGSAFVGVAVQMLMSGVSVTVPTSIGEIVATLASVAAGVALTLVWTRRRRWWPRWVTSGIWVGLLLGVVIVMLGALTLAHHFAYLFNPFMLAIGVTSATVLTFGVERARKQVLLGRESIS